MAGKYKRARKLSLFPYVLPEYKSGSLINRGLKFKTGCDMIWIVVGCSVVLYDEIETTAYKILKKIHTLPAGRVILIKSHKSGL